MPRRKIVSIKGLVANKKWFSDPPFRKYDKSNNLSGRLPYFLPTGTRGTESPSRPKENKPNRIKAQNFNNNDCRNYKIE